MNVNARIEALRQYMKYNEITAYIVPSSDPHQSEYVADYWKCREWISGFDGSAGTVIVTLDHAGLWTDGRYFLQAEDQLADSEMVLHKLKVQGQSEYLDWLGQNLQAGNTVGFDAKVLSAGQAKQLKQTLKKYDLKIAATEDPFKSVWKDRTALPLDPIFEIPTTHSGQSRAEKLAELRTKIRKKGATQILVSALDNICWLFNIRGRDVDFNPVCIAYALVSSDLATLYINPVKVEAALLAKLKEDNIIVKDYNAITSDLENLLASDAILIDSKETSHQCFECIENASIIACPNPIKHAKSIKNKTEKHHIEQAMIKDAVALTNFYRWIEENIPSSHLTEYDLAHKLAAFRKEQDGYFGESFSAIIGFQGNGAIIHYRPEKDQSKTINGEGMLLIDSGGQYSNGTTDITRTTYLGTPSAEHKDAYTRVLKGHIDIATLIFPEGTTGVQMDILARRHLWKAGLNYGHGTGHGVGFFLNVHEPPQGIISGMGERGQTVHEIGMFTSNEPGYYKAGEFGIRIENLVMAEACEAASLQGYLRFDTLTLFPIDTQLINEALLSTEDIEWINDYHSKVLAKLTPHLQPDALDWMQLKCKAI